MSGRASRIAGAPISWGVCEVPGWGHQLPATRVLSEMAGLGIEATEFGPAGFLPEDTEARAALLRERGLRPVGGFLCVVLFEDSHDPLAEVDKFIDEVVATGAEVVVLAAVTGMDGYDARLRLTEAQWSTLLRNLDRIDRHARDRGVLATLHPHVGTLVENDSEVRRVLEGSTIPLTLDTGHLLAGGVDPVSLARCAARRVAHVHLKDVDADLADRVATGDVAYSTAVASGLFRPLGTGDVDIAALVDTLQRSGYDGWYVLEQDVMLEGEPAGEGPVVDVRTSLDYLTKVLA